VAGAVALGSLGKKLSRGSPGSVSEEKEEEEEARASLSAGGLDDCDTLSSSLVRGSDHLHSFNL